MSRPSDWQQRQMARDLHHSYIVQAPAGSGKTELLTQRMLGLLALVENPEEVVAITFTRKAAAEMSYRLVGRLQAAAKAGKEPGDDGELEAHERISRELSLSVLENDTARGWNLLECPSRLRIRTIDSLCSELARQLPVLSGLGGEQKIAVNADALYRKAATRTLAVIEDDRDDLRTDVIRVLDRYDNQYDRLVELLTSMLASREQWISHLLNSRKGEGFDRQGLEQALRCLVENELESARQIIPGHLLRELPRFYRYALSNQPVNAAELKNLLDAAGGFDCDFLDLPTTAEALPQWKTMISGLLTNAGEMRKSAPDTNAGFPAPTSAKAEDQPRFKAWKDEFKELLDEYSGHDSLMRAFNTIRTLPSPDYEDEAWESLESLMRMMLRAAAEWDLVMAESGEVDFSEMSNRAIRSLGAEGAPTDLALRMDYRIQHLLVDEFQDTSASQIRLLRQLTAGWSDGDGRSLFLVGDPMQSIYRFRKAEVSLFIKAWQGQLFDHIQLEQLQLTVNFRSTRPIVEWVNRTFPQVMPMDDDPVTGAVSYSEASTRPNVTGTGTVALKILPQRDDEEEARQAIQLIGRCSPEESIAILVRSRAHASAILAKLDDIKLDQPRFRYQAINFTPLADTTLIKDLVSLTLALIQPADRLAWLSTLRAPYIGLDLADMDALVAGNCGNIILDAITEAAGKDSQIGLSDDGRRRLQRTGPGLLQAVERRGRQSIRSLVESAWITLGGPACVNNTSELEDASTYFGLLDSLEDENLPVDRDTLDLRLKDLYAEPDAMANGNLQILTIYAAKGLQFDTVILPGLNRRPGGDNSQLLHWFELVDEDRIVMSPMRNSKEKERQKKSADLIQFISAVEKERQGLEDSRLLYVAATRAVHSLYLFAAVKPKANGNVCPDAASLMGCLWPAVREQQTPLILIAAEDLPATAEEGDSEEIESALRAPALPQVYRRLAADWQLPKLPDPIQLLELACDEASDYIEFSWAGEDARLTGNLVHRLLRVIGEQGLEYWTTRGGMAGYHSWCRRHLASQGVQAGEAAAIIERISLAMANCVASEEGKWILGNHEDARCEYGITAVLGQTSGTTGQPRTFVLDRTFVENGTRWIIDYKTSSHSGGDLAAFLESETKRYREQLHGYKSAMALSETRPIRTALYFPMLDRFLELN